MPRYLHLADLHLGKRLGGYPLLEDQREVLFQALDVIGRYGVDEVFIAGDIYDRSSPPEEAMALFDSFLTQLHERRIPVSFISGNHDAAGRISYFSGLLDGSGIRAPERFEGCLQPVKAADAPVQIWLLPFVQPGTVRRFFPDRTIETYEDAVRAVLENSPVDERNVNILLAHQFITGGAVCDSEEFSVGGLDSISSDVFAAFDYVALGHLHQPQHCGRETVRYAGSPLKYSLSEEKQTKSFTVVDVRGKGSISIEEIPIQLPHDVRTVRDRLAVLMSGERTEDYVRCVITDEDPPPDARMMLRSNFPRMLRFAVENSRVRLDREVFPEEKPEQRTPLAMFTDFFMHQNNGTPPSEEQLALAAEIFAQLQEEAGA